MALGASVVGQDRVQPPDLAHPVAAVEPGHIVDQERVRLDRDDPADPALPRQERRDEADPGADLQHPVAGTHDVRDLEGFLGLEPPGDDRPMDGRGDDRRVERNHHPAVEQRFKRVLRGSGFDHRLQLAGFRSPVYTPR